MASPLSAVRQIPVMDSLCSGTLTIEGNTRGVIETCAIQEQLYASRVLPSRIRTALTPDQGSTGLGKVVPTKAIVYADVLCTVSARPDSATHRYGYSVIARSVEPSLCLIFYRVPAVSIRSIADLL